MLVRRNHTLSPQEAAISGAESPLDTTNTAIALLSMHVGAKQASKRVINYNRCFRPHTHGNVSLHFCIVSSNELVVLHSLENSINNTKTQGNVSVCTIDVNN